MLTEVWDACWDMMTPGGVIAVNVGSVLESGYHYPLPLDVIQSFESSSKDWRFLKTVLWHKVTAGVKRAGSVIQHRLPGYWYPNIMTEHIILFQKPGGALRVNTDVPGTWLDTVWDIAPVPPKKINHPAPFPEEIPHRLIRLFTTENSWIMDPFNGAGATSKAAVDLGRNALGFDIEPKYVDMAKERLHQASGIREQQLTMSLVPRGEFVPGKAQGKTRHGAGIASRKKVE